MKIKQILLCMLLACFILPASAQNSWGIVGGGLFSKSLSRDARFSLGGYAGGMYDVHVKNSWYVQPQLIWASVHPIHDGIATVITLYHLILVIFFQ